MAEDVGNASVTCHLRLEFSSAEIARRIMQAVELDNEDYIRARLDGPSIVADVKAQSLNSLLHTLDDFLSCTSLAEKVSSGEVTPPSP